MITFFYNLRCEGTVTRKVCNILQQRDKLDEETDELCELMKKSCKEKYHEKKKADNIKEQLVVQF